MWFAALVSFVQPVAQAQPSDVSLREQAQAAFQALGMEKPWPEVRVVHTDNKFLAGPEVIAQASILTVSGEVLFINRSAIEGRGVSRSQKMRRGPDFIAGTIRHEASHFGAWRRYGLKIAEHGREFMRVCRGAFASRHCSAIN